MALELCNSFERVSPKVSEQARSSNRASDLGSEELAEMEHLRSVEWRNSGLAREVMVLAEKDFDF
jgi:hypothetical protein